MTNHPSGRKHYTMSPDSSRNNFRIFTPGALLFIAVTLLFSSACSQGEYRPSVDEHGRTEFARRSSKNLDRGLLFLRSRETYKTLEHPYADAASSVGLFDPASDTADKEGFIAGDTLPGEFSAAGIAYYKINQKRYPENAFSTDQAVVLRRMGSPQAVRKFTSLRNEKIEEWLFLHRRKVVQFCQGRTVFLGNMTDQNETLYTQGRPDYAIVAEYKNGPGHLTFVYRNQWGRDMRTFTFTRDGDLVDSIR